MFQPNPRGRESGDEVAAWISMTDAFALIAMIALIVGTGAVRKSNALGEVQGVEEALFSMFGLDPGRDAQRLLHEVTILKEERDRLKAAQQDLERRAAACEAELAKLSGDGERLAELETAKAKLEQELQVIAAERDDLRAKLEKCESECRILREAIGQGKQAESESEQANDQKIRDLAQRLQKAESDLERLRTEHATCPSTEAVAKTRAELDAALLELDSVRAALLSCRQDADRGGRGSIARELLGLKGKLDRVVFVLDGSDSMEGKDVRNPDGRWRSTQETIRTWLEYLEFEKSALVIFNSTVKRFPADGTWLDRDSRATLVEQIAEFNPSGVTKTLEALKVAYEYTDADAIILFTDGKPDSGRSGGSATEVLQLVEQKRKDGRDVPIHVVAIGDYFDKNFGKFLLELSGKSGGTFIGR